MPTALISAFNKDGIVPFAKTLIDLGWTIISSGGTARVLSEAGLAVTDVAEISGLPAVLGHRVVTLVPHMHGGWLATEDQRAELNQLGYPWIDLCCVDFYPLKQAIEDPSATEMSVIEKTDIGGPTMVRSAAKGRRIVVVDPADRVRVLEWIKAGQPDQDAFKRQLAAKAEGVVADYCLQAAHFHSDGAITGSVNFS